MSHVPQGIGERARLVRWPVAGFLAVLASLALELDRLDVARDFVGALAYRSALSLAVGLVLSSVLAVVDAVARRRPWLARIALALAVCPFAYIVSARLAGGGAVMDRGIPPVPFALGGAAILSAFAGGLGTLPRARGWARGTLVAVGVLAAACVRLVPGTYVDLVDAAALVCAVVVTLLAVDGIRDRRELVLAASLAVAALGTALFVGMDRARFVDARHAALVHAGAASRVDLRLLGPDERVLRSVHFDVDAVPPGACEGGASVSPLSEGTSRSELDFLVVTIDALRRDAVGRTVNGLSVTPTLDALRQRTVAPELAVSNYAATLFSIGGAFSGLAASRLVLAPEPPPTLLARLRSRVDRVLAIVPGGPYFERDVVRAYLLHDVPHESAANAIAAVDATLATLRAARAHGERVAVWTHFFEAHDPYDVHPGFHRGDDARGRYLGEVAFVDAELGRLVRALESDGALDRTVVLVFADHGESLGERGHYGHHRFLDGWITDVPFFLWVPGRAGLEIRPTVQLLDVAPTIARLAGLELPSDLVGTDMLDTRTPERAIVSESFSTASRALTEVATTPVRDLADLRRRIELVHRGFDGYPPLVSIVSGRYRMIVGRRTGVVQLFDRLADPGDTHDLVRTRSDVRERLLGELRAWHHDQSVAIRCAFERARTAAPRGSPIR